MHIPSILASLIAFSASVALLEFTRSRRKASSAVNLILIVVALLLSVFLASEASQSPEASGGHLFYLWVAYALYSTFVRKKQSKSANPLDTTEEDGGAV
jgi:peptidoglycan/LPS O-acetylase OafA/YrhL